MEGWMSQALISVNRNLIEDSEVPELPKKFY